MNIEWRGVKETAQNLVKRGERVRVVEQDAMLEAVLYVHSQMPGYPPALPNSRYRRTGKLGQSVTALSGKAEGALSRVEMLGGNAVGVIGTAIGYAPLVIGEGTQKAIHKGRWWTLQKVVEDAREKIIEIFERRIGKEL